MEEILASIRKIIAEDTNESPAPPKQEAKVLELTQEVHHEPQQTQVAPPPPLPPMQEEPELSAAFAEPESVSMTTAPSGSVDAEYETSTSANEDTQVSSSAQALSHEGIFSDSTRQAIEQTFAGLDQVNVQRAPEARPSFAPVEGNSIEAVFERAVRASVDPGLQRWMDSHHDEILHAVKPLLRDWMDEHFPALLEGAVREEVARVIRARGR